MSLLQTHRDRYIPLIQERLDYHQQHFLQHDLSGNAYINDLIIQSIARCAWGKKIRGLLALIGHEVSGWKNVQDAMDIACALEIFQTSILIHDDIIDQSAVRRWQTTIHTQLGGIYGIGQAICVWDIGFFIANNLLTHLQFSPTVIIELIQMFNTMLISTWTGEMLDIYLPMNKEVSLELIDKVMLLKTARYTISYPLMMGAITGLTDRESPQSHEYMQLLSQFGDAVGISFQIMDDIQGLYGDELVLWKSTHSDILEGKKTILRYHVQQNAQGEDKNLIADRYGNPHCDVWHIQLLRDCFQRLGARDFAYQQAFLYLQKARDILQQLPVIDDDGRKILSDLIELIQSSSH